MFLNHDPWLFRTTADYNYIVTLQINYTWYLRF